MILGRYNPRRLVIGGHVPLYAWFLIAILICWLWISRSPLPQDGISDIPLVKQYIEFGVGEGGRWYIPPSWLEQAANDGWFHPDARTTPQTVLEAAQLSLVLSLRNRKFLRHSNIPLIIHQTWKNFESATWSDLVRHSVEEWLETATNASGSTEYPEMAYIMWDDQGAEDFIEMYEPRFWEGYTQLPRIVEKTDSFRVAVLKWFGGVYADVDTRPLQHPYNWVKDSDLEDWTDTNHSITHSVQTPQTKCYIPPASATDLYKDLLENYAPSEGDISAIYGIEGDNFPDRDDYWRMGYLYPVQLLNWAFAMAPHHPTATRFISELTTTIEQNATRLAKIDPLELTGPGPLVTAVRGHVEDDNPEFYWNALSGRLDPKGGRGKVAAGDILVLPITGFSPGRGWFHNMGSEPLSHTNARLYHAAAGSWREEPIQVQIGKLCRTFLGRCKDWSKIS